LENNDFDWALGIEGMRCSTVVDGAVNSDVFEAFVKQVLLPTLRADDVVVMDNLSSHKCEKTRELIESVGAHLVFCRRIRRTSIPLK
jgi:transposase